MSNEKANQLGLTPKARIRSMADFAQDPVQFTTSPTYAVERALKLANMEMKDIGSFFYCS